ncbi:MAG: rhomboid family intramembrane serine protease [Lachnospiraceae bacterium]|nr:rhomboid family intramembrane serine protease [Lachnospiraceae bacterium]
MNKLERKFGKYAIPNLPLIIIICYGIGYALSIIDRQNIILSLLALDANLILKGQVWRLVSWVLIPPSSFDFFTIIMLLFYYSIGRTLDRVWGSFRFNLYIFSGMIFTIIGSFVLYGLFVAFPGLMPIQGASLDYNCLACGVSYFSTFYINMSIFLAFAATFPDNVVYLMFILPLKMKWLGIAYVVILAAQVLSGSASERVVIVMSLLNFVLFFFLYRKENNQTIRQRFEQAQRRRNFEQQYNRGAYSAYGQNRGNAGYQSGSGSDTNRSNAYGAPFGGSQMSKHRCAICGRTELDNPDLQFRFCSKCNGNYEYCNDHLFTHTHAQ